MVRTRVAIACRLTSRRSVRSEAGRRPGHLASFDAMSTGVGLGAQLVVSLVAWVVSGASRRFGAPVPDVPRPQSAWGGRQWADSVWNGRSGGAPELPGTRFLLTGRQIL